MTVRVHVCMNERESERESERERERVHCTTVTLEQVFAVDCLYPAFLG